MGLVCVVWVCGYRWGGIRGDLRGCVRWWHLLLYVLTCYIIVLQGNCSGGSLMVPTRGRLTGSLTGQAHGQHHGQPHGTYTGQAHGQPHGVFTVF